MKKRLTIGNWLRLLALSCGSRDVLARFMLPWHLRSAASAIQVMLPRRTAKAMPSQSWIRPTTRSACFSRSGTLPYCDSPVDWPACRHHGTLDGKIIYEWKGDIRRLILHDSLDVFHPERPAIQTHKGRFEIRDLKLANLP